MIFSDIRRDVDMKFRTDPSRMRTTVLPAEAVKQEQERRKIDEEASSTWQEQSSRSWQERW